MLLLSKIPGFGTSRCADGHVASICVKNERLTEVRAALIKRIFNWWNVDWYFSVQRLSDCVRVVQSLIPTYMYFTSLTDMGSTQCLITCTFSGSVATSTLEVKCRRYLTQRVLPNKIISSRFMRHISLGDHTRMSPWIVRRLPEHSIFQTESYWTEITPYL